MCTSNSEFGRITVLVGIALSFFLTADANAQIRRKSNTWTPTNKPSADESVGSKDSAKKKKKSETGSDATSLNSGRRVTNANDVGLGTPITGAGSIPLTGGVTFTLGGLPGAPVRSSSSSSSMPGAPPGLGSNSTSGMASGGGSSSGGHGGSSSMPGSSAGGSSHSAGGGITVITPGAPVNGGPSTSSPSDPGSSNSTNGGPSGGHGGTLPGAPPPPTPDIGPPPGHQGG